MRIRSFALALGLLLAAGPVSAQSLWGGIGLGLPLDGIDARARALGNIGLGLSGPALLPTDPAAAARNQVPSGVLVAQPSWVDASSGGATNSFRGTRFPLLAAAYPVLGGVASLHFRPHLDQDFSGVRESTVILGGDTAVARDAFNQDGSVASINIGYAATIWEGTSVGITVGRYTGSLDRTLVRTAEEGDTTTVQPYVSDGSWSYSGYLITGGVATRLLDLVDLAVSATWSTKLDAEASAGTEGGDGSYDLPLELRLGASAELAPGLSLSASASRADWTGVSLNSEAEGETVLAYGVGLELAQARLLGRQAPIRVGFRRSDLPFSLASESASERTFSGGLGLVLNQAGEVVLANVDLAVERGRRKAGSVTEDFWRATLSLRVAGL